MKKSFLLFSSLLLLGTGFLIFFQHSLLKEKDHVTFQDTLHLGSAEAAEGITVKIHNQYDRHLFWDTSYRAGSCPEVSTDYTFYDSRQERDLRTEEGIHMDINFDSYYFDPSKDRSELKGLDQAFYDLYYSETPAMTQEAAAGENRKTKVVKMSDYYQYYPLYFYISLKNYDRHWNWEDTHYYDAEDKELEFLKQYFRIPVIEDDTRNLMLDLYRGSYSTCVTSSDTNYYMSAYSAVTEDSLYFLFNLTKNGFPTEWDSSLIPGGFGIYRIPYETLPQKPTQLNPQKKVDITNLEMVFSLDKSIQPYLFTTNPDKTRLILAYEDVNTPESCVQIDIIDTKTMTTIQTITLNGVDKPDGSTEVMIPYSIHVYDDFIAIPCSGNYLAVLDLESSGLYSLAFLIDIHENPVFEYSIDLRGATVMDRKGSQIAIAGLKSKSVGHNYHYYSESCGFYLAIFDESGLIYFSEHGSSLDRGQYPYSNATPTPLSYYEGDTPLKITWN